MEKINLIVGYDKRETIAYHVFCQSVIERVTIPVQFIPLAKNSLAGYEECHNDGSNEFSYTRFLSPWLMNYEGWAIYLDGDMVCNDDIFNLWILRDSSKAVQVVKHDYQTKANIKYLGNKNEMYPKKNWSSVMLWNCEHPKNKQLTPSLIQQKEGSFLHQFQWLSDDEIGELPLVWNWLASEYVSNSEAKIIHYTLGTPCFMEYRNEDMADLWEDCFKRATTGME